MDVRRGPGATAGALLRACHPEPTIGVTVVLGLLAVTAGAGRLVPLVVAAVAANQLSIGWDNDALDADRDRRAGRADKPVADGSIAPGVVRRAAVVATVVCAVLSVGLGWRAAVANLVCVASGWTYNHLAKPTPVSVVPYLTGFGALAAVVPLAVGSPVPVWLVTAGALLGAAAHFANVVPDIALDRAEGVLGLPQRLGATGSRVTFAGLLVAASVVLAFGPGGGPLAAGVVAVAVVLVGAGLATGRAAGSRTLFRVAIGVAVLDVAMLVVRGGAIR